MFGLHSKFKYKQVVIVREDLKLSKGKLSVQVAHAAVSCAIKAEKNKNNFFFRMVHRRPEESCIESRKS